MIPAASGGFSLPTSGPLHDALFIGAGVVVLLAFFVAARLVARFAGDQLRKRQVRGDMVVLGRRVVTAMVLVLGLFAALGFAVQSANVTLFGLLLATIVAALGVQQLLQDYVSGYYVLLERHIRVGDRITFDSQSGTVTDVRLRVTLIKSDEGDLIVVPNSELFTKPVTVHNKRPVEPRTEPPT
jgi:small-conductance mechanosensitive channel